jgi:hypothetical protein
MPYQYIEVVRSINSEPVWRMNVDHMFQAEVTDYIREREKKLNKTKFHIEPHISEVKLETGPLYGEPDEEEAIEPGERKRGRPARK